MNSAAFTQGAPQNSCRTIPVRGNASDWPSKHAWDIFISLNHPALSKTVARGVPDCTKPFGAPGTTAVWETWRNARTEVYLSNGAEPPLWDDTTLPDEKPGQVPPLPQQEHGPGPLFSPVDGIFHGAGGFGETRLNRSTYEFVRSQCLFSIEGQQRYAAAVQAGKKPPIQFPSDSIEAKAAWLDFDDKDNPVPVEKRGTYYTAEFQGKKFGLVALHILTKDLSNWFWATFHHKDAPADAFGNPDTYGPPKDVAGTVWENYRLGGTQVEFTLPTGEPTIMSDHYIEFGFVRSSCMTCHATAAISREIVTPPPPGRPFTSMPRAQQKAVCAISPDLKGDDLEQCKAALGEDAYKPGTGTLLVERGVPDSRWFQRNGDSFYLQTDFVWSIPFRGRSETVPPPNRCIW
jgi:hypothetical protein